MAERKKNDLQVLSDDMLHHGRIVFLSSEYEKIKNNFKHLLAIIIKPVIFQRYRFQNPKSKTGDSR